MLLLLKQLAIWQLVFHFIRPGRLTRTIFTTGFGLSSTPRNTKNNNYPAMLAAAAAKRNLVEEKSRSGLNKPLQELTVNISLFDKRLNDARRIVEAGEEVNQDVVEKVLATCDSTDQLRELLDILGLHPDSRKVKMPYRACLKWCHKKSQASLSEKVFQVMEQIPGEIDGADVSLHIKTLCQANKRERYPYGTALALIQACDTQDISAYDAVLQCLSFDGLWKECIRLLRQMQEKKIRPALSTYAVVIGCCLYCKQPEQAAQVLDTCIREGTTPSVTLFERVIAGLSRKLQWRRAMQFLQAMDDLMLPKTREMYNSLLAATIKSGEAVQSKNLLQRMKKEGIRPNTLSYNAVIAACANPRHWKDALLVFDQCLREPGVAPDIYTYTNAIRACAKGGNADRALALLQVAKDLKLPVDAYAYTATIEAMAKVKMWKKALSLLDEMEQSGIAPTEVTYSVTITACGNSGQWEKALEILDIMAAKHMKINLVTYNAAIAALSKGAKLDKCKDKGSELWETAISLLRRMKNDGLEPDGFSYSAAISCCGTYGRWEPALELFNSMKAGGIRTQPNKIAYTAAISSCAKAGQSKQAAHLFREMKENGLKPDLVAYNSLFSAYRVAGEGDRAFQLWNELVSEHSGIPGTASVTPSPDIITVTEVIGALNQSGPENLIDTVFEEAVRRGIIFDADCFDTNWEVDLTKMTLSVARAACRFVLKGAANSYRSNAMVEDIVFITGVGRHHDNEHPSLRDFVRELLLNEFIPPIQSSIPLRASGTVVVTKDDFVTWARVQSKERSYKREDDGAS